MFYHLLADPRSWCFVNQNVFLKNVEPICPNCRQRRVSWCEDRSLILADALLQLQSSLLKVRASLSPQGQQVLGSSGGCSQLCHVNAGRTKLSLLLLHTSCKALVLRGRARARQAAVTHSVFG